MFRIFRAAMMAAMLTCAVSALFDQHGAQAASVASKAIVPGAVYPLGVVTALVGVPFFFGLVLRSPQVRA